MLVSMIAVISLDGCITRHDDPETKHWASADDQTRFRTLTAQCDVQIFGAGTYRAARDVIRRVANPAMPRHVVTRDPSAFAADAMPGALEFTSDPPGALVERLRAQGHRRCALLGGGTIYGEYLGAGVVDELHLTIEPLVFGTGTHLAGGHVVDVGFRLREVERLNDSTLHVVYDRR